MRFFIHSHYENKGEDANAVPQRNYWSDEPTEEELEDARIAENFIVLEHELRAAIIERRLLMQPVPTVSETPPRNEVDRLARVHQAQIQSQTDEIRRGRLGRLNTQIAKYRSDLARRHVQADANGMILNSPVKMPRVIYDHDEALQNATRIHISGARLYADPQFQTPLDTSKTSNYWSGAGVAIYVMSAGGNLHVSSQLKGYRHHSSLLAAANVATAGELKVENGWLRMINNQSGHYQPDCTHLYQVVHQLTRLGVPPIYRVVSISNYPPHDEYTASEFLRLGRRSYEDGRLLAYLSQATPELLDKLGWTFSATDVGKKFGAYDKTSARRIPYKQTVATLKANGVTPVVHVAQPSD